MSAETLGNKSGSSAEISSTVALEVQQNLRRLDRLANLGLVSASVAHEIKNGLVAIKTFVELLSQKSDDPEMVDVVQRELKRIDALVTQMLRYSAPKPPVFATVKIHELLDHSLLLIEHQMAERLIVLERDYKAKPDVLRGDESQLQQALMNLLLNAVEAIGNNGNLRVATETIAASKCESGQGLKIFIRDTGSGIAKENWGHLFEPFFTTKKNGTGLGLAITQRVMEEHRGTVEVQSEPKRGSTFILTFPV